MRLTLGMCVLVPPQSCHNRRCSLVTSGRLSEVHRVCMWLDCERNNLSTYFKEFPKDQNLSCYKYGNRGQVYLCGSNVDACKIWSLLLPSWLFWNPLSLTQLIRRNRTLISLPTKELTDFFLHFRQFVASSPARLWYLAFCLCGPINLCQSLADSFSVNVWGRGPVHSILNGSLKCHDSALMPCQGD